MKKYISDFFNGIISLVISQILIKVFGVIYSLYITNKTGFGDEGNAIYMSGYQIYALLLTISSIGVPNAISKLVSEKKIEGDYTNKDRIFKISLFLFAFIGTGGALGLFLFSEIIAYKFLEIPEATQSLMILAPAVFFVSINSVIKGYFNGVGKIVITAKSQFFEQILKSIFTIIFVEIVSRISNNNTEAMATVANFATTMATGISLIYMIKKYIEIRNLEIYYRKSTYKKERIKDLISKVIRITIPMTLNSILSSFGKNVDSLTIVRILKHFISENAAKIKYGIISSKIDILISMPLSFNSSISTALIPEISKKKAENDLEGILEKIELSILMTLIISIPYSFGVLFYSKQIFEILFPNAKDGYQLLSIGSIGIIFSMLTQTMNGILQGLGKNKTPVIASFWGLIVKVLSNIILIPINGVFEKGAILGNILSSIVSFTIVYISLKKIIILKNNLFKLFLKPFLGSILMIIISKSFYKLLIFKEVNNIISNLISIAIAVISYVFCIFFMKIFNKNTKTQNP